MFKTVLNKDLKRYIILVVAVVCARTLNSYLQDTGQITGALT
jgi:hypothetical protein